MLVSAPHAPNAKAPMVVTEFGMVMLVSASHLENAFSPMILTLFGISMLFFPPGHCINIFLSLLYNTPSIEA